MPAAAGSSSRIRSGPTSSMPSTPLAWARAASVSSRGQLCRGQRDDQLAGMPDRDPLILGEPLELDLAFAAERRLERARGVVDAGVDDAAVVARLVAGELGLLLDDGEPELRSPAQQPIGGGQSDDSAADHDDVEPLVPH